MDLLKTPSLGNLVSNRLNLYVYTFVYIGLPQGRVIKDYAYFSLLICFCGIHIESSIMGMYCWARRVYH